MAKAAALIIIYLGAFYCMGMLFPARWHRNRLADLLLLGFVTYFSVFQAVALPMKLAALPLHVLTLTWGGILAAVLIFVIAARRKNIAASLHVSFSEEGTGWLFLYAAAALAVAVVLGLNTNHISDFDAGYYIGLPAASVYSDTIEQMNPFSGNMIGFNKFYFLNTNTIHSAVMAQAFGVPPLVEEKFSLTCALSLLFSVTVWRAGTLLFKENRRHTAVFGLISLLVLWYSYSLTGVSHYFAYRTYEGKSVCAYLYPALVFVFFLLIALKKGIHVGWCGLILASFSGAAFSNTAFFVLPVMIATMLAPTLLMEKRWKEIALLAAAVLPSAVWAVVYLAVG